MNTYRCFCKSQISIDFKHIFLKEKRFFISLHLSLLFTYQILVIVFPISRDTCQNSLRLVDFGWLMHTFDWRRVMCGTIDYLLCRNKTGLKGSQNKSCWEWEIRRSPITEKSDSIHRWYGIIMPHKLTRIIV